jgi:hypothetical protein
MPAGRFKIPVSDPCEAHAELKSGLLYNLLRMVTQITHRLAEEVMALEG